jgi:hypothetical protein
MTRAVFEMGGRYHAHVGLQGTFQLEKSLATWESLHRIGNVPHLMLGARVNRPGEAIVAALAVGIFEESWSDHRYGSEMFYCLEPGAWTQGAMLMLLKAAEVWVESQGYRELRMGSLQQGEDNPMVLLYRRAGLVPMATMFRKEW